MKKSKKTGWMSRKKRKKLFKDRIVEKITLKSGIIVGNFSSPHQFLFDTGEVLPGVSPEVSRERMVESHEEETLNEKGWTDISLRFSLNEEVEKLLREAQKDVDVLLVSLPTLTAWKEAGYEVGKLRTVRVKDRATKEVFADKFCV